MIENWFRLCIRARWREVSKGLLAWKKGGRIRIKRGGKKIAQLFARTRDTRRQWGLLLGYNLNTHRNHLVINVRPNSTI